MGILTTLGIAGLTIAVAKSTEKNASSSKDSWKNEKCPAGGKHKEKYYASGDGGYYCKKCMTFLHH